MTALTKFKLKFLQDHIVNSFYKNLENLLSGYRIKSIDEVYIIHTVRNEMREVIDVKFPTVHWGKLKWKFKGEIQFGLLTFDEKSELKSLMNSRFDGLLLELSKKGVNDVYLKRGKELFLERLNRLADDECPEALFEKIYEYYYSCLRSESLEVQAKKHRHQYNVNTELDLFYIALERLLGFERIRNSNNGGYKLVVQLQRNDEDGAAFPELVYTGPMLKGGNKPRLVKGGKHWKSYSSGAKDAYRRLTLTQFDSAMAEYFYSGSLDRYAIRGRELLLERLTHLADCECPKKVLKEVLELYKKWFRLDDSAKNVNHNIFSFDYLINESAIPTMSSSTTDDEISDYDNVELVEDLDVYILGTNTQCDDNEFDEDYESQENEAALQRLADDESKFDTDLDI
jgi:hypothetical protein